MEFLILNHGLTVPKVFFLALFHRVLEITPAMEPGVIYTLKVLCGEDFWSMYTDGQKRIAGQCMVHMVEHRMLPLHFAEGRHEYPKFYWRA
jgi:hypothetical protein